LYQNDKVPTLEPHQSSDAATGNIQKKDEAPTGGLSSNNQLATSELSKSTGTGTRKPSEDEETGIKGPSEKSASSERKEPAAQNPLPEFIFDPLTEIPTLSQQHSVKEINEMIGIRDASLNDKLKENKKEVGHILKDHPIRDLKKAIGVN